MTYERFCRLCRDGEPKDVEHALKLHPEFAKGNPNNEKEDNSDWGTPLSIACCNEKHGFAIANLLLAADADVNDEKKSRLGRIMARELHSVISSLNVVRYNDFSGASASVRNRSSVRRANICCPCFMPVDYPKLDYTKLRAPDTASR